MRKSLSALFGWSIARDSKEHKEMSQQNDQFYDPLELFSAFQNMIEVACKAK